MFPLCHFICKHIRATHPTTGLISSSLLFKWNFEKKHAFIQSQTLQLRRYDNRSALVSHAQSRRRRYTKQSYACACANTVQVCWSALALQQTLINLYSTIIDHQYEVVRRPLRVALVEQLLQLEGIERDSLIIQVKC